MKPEDLITYCGGYCSYCARWHEHAAFIQLAGALAELADAHGYQYWMPTEVKEFDYNEFRKALDFFSKKDSWLVCRKRCKQGDGNPLCEIRKCCQERGLDICFECDELPCDRVKENVKMIERAKEYKELGKEEWLRRQIDKAEKRYEAHTKKYYRICVDKEPPE